MTGKVRLEHRIDACVCDSGNREHGLSDFEGREPRVDRWIDVRLGNLYGFVNVRFRLLSEVNADQTIPLRGLAQHGRGLAP